MDRYICPAPDFYMFYCRFLLFLSFPPRMELINDIYFLGNFFAFIRKIGLEKDPTPSPLALARDNVIKGPQSAVYSRDKRKLTPN
jgi:hypothetical protein